MTGTSRGPADPGNGRAQDGWVLFDLDGTLFDYDRSEAVAVAATLADAGVDATDEVVAAYREANARHWRLREAGRTTPQRLRVDRWHDTFAQVGVTPAVAVSRLAERYVRHLATGHHLLDGAIDVVRDVGRTHRIAYLTNGLADVQRPRLDASPLGPFAEVVIISDEVGAAKPEPAIFDAAFAAMGDPPRAAVTVVGDSLTADIAGAVRYGLRSVWFAPHATEVPTGPARPDHHIRALQELPALLRPSGTTGPR